MSMNVKLTKLSKIIWLFIFLINLNGCKKIENSNQIKEEINTSENSEVFLNLKKSKDKNKIETILEKIYEINDSTTIKINNYSIEILINNESFSTNNKILRKRKQQNCIAEGFKDLVSKNKYFTIEKQNCSNKYLIEEYITFKLEKEFNEILLHALGYSYVSKMNPNEKISDKVFRTEDFGKIKFENVDTDRLFVKLMN